MKQILLVAPGGRRGGGVPLRPHPAAHQRQISCSTLLANLAGALIIGFLAGCAAQISKFPPELNLLLKTGFCGGFTTFSTFSLDTVSLLQQHRYLAGVATPL